MERFERVWSDELEAIDLANFRPSQYPMRRICVRQPRPGRRRHGQDFKSSSDVRRRTSSDFSAGYRNSTHVREITAQPTAQSGVATTTVKPAAIELLDEKRRTALSHAAGEGRVEEVRSLLAQQYVKADSRDAEGRTPLSHAAERGHDEVVWLLLTRRDVEAYSVDAKKLTPLSHAVREGHEAVVNLYLARDDVRAYLRDVKDGTDASLPCIRRRERISSSDVPRPR